MKPESNTLPSSARASAFGTWTLNSGYVFMSVLPVGDDLFDGQALELVERFVEDAQIGEVLFQLFARHHFMVAGVRECGVVARLEGRAKHVVRAIVIEATEPDALALVDQVLVTFLAGSQPDDLDGFVVAPGEDVGQVTDPHSWQTRDPRLTRLALVEGLLDEIDAVVQRHDEPCHRRICHGQELTVLALVFEQRDDAAT